MLQQMLNRMFGNNPMFQRAMQMAQGKTPEQIEQIAENLCRERGIDVNEAYKNFQREVGRLFGSK